MRAAFYHTDRQALLDNVAKYWGEAINLISPIYSTPTLQLYKWFDEEGHPHISAIYSCEGCRIGCVLGSLLFNLTAHETICKLLAAEDPSWIVRAIADDLPLNIAPPHDPTSPDNWNTTFYSVVKFLTSYTRYAATVNLHPNHSKLKILLPDNAPDPPPYILTALARLHISPNIFTREGIPLGAPPLDPTNFAEPVQKPSSTTNKTSLSTSSTSLTPAPSSLQSQCASSPTFHARTSTSRH